MTDQPSFPGATSRIAIIDLQSGQTVDGVYACSELTAATDRNGKKYLRLKLRDASGEVAAIHFDPSDEALGLAAGDVVSVGGTYSVHPQYGAQIQVRRLRAAEDDEYDAGDLVQVTPDDYGRIPVTGTLVTLQLREVAIRRIDPRAGEVVVHFPRMGYRVERITA